MVKEVPVKTLAQFLLASYEVEDKKQKASLTFFRLFSCLCEFKWIRKCISENAYHQAIRELRFVLDSLIKAYYVDREHPDSDMQCKLEIVKEVEDLYGSRLIDRTDLEHGKALKKLYGELCKYVHSSYRELLSTRPRDSKKIANLEFEPDSEMENLCQDFVMRTMDVVFLVALGMFPEILGPATKYSKIRELWLEASKELGFEFALTKLRANDKVITKAGAQLRG
jgi:hypothetical protein